MSKSKPPDACAARPARPVGAHALHAQGKTNTAPARKASPQSLDYWAAKIDPDAALPAEERYRRAGHARKAYMYRLALKSAQAPSKPGAA